MPSMTSGGLIKSSQQWTPDEHAWLKARAERLGLRSVSAVVAMLVRTEMDAERAAKEGAAA